MSTGVFSDQNASGWHLPGWIYSRLESQPSSPELVLVPTLPGDPKSSDRWIVASKTRGTLLAGSEMFMSAAFGKDSGCLRSWAMYQEMISKEKWGPWGRTQIMGTCWAVPGAWQDDSWGLEDCFPLLLWTVHALSVKSVSLKKAALC